MEGFIRIPQSRFNLAMHDFLEMAREHDEDVRQSTIAETEEMFKFWHERSITSWKNLCNVQRLIEDAFGIQFVRNRNKIYKKGCITLLYEEEEV
jgi:hypothetical protein